MSLKLYNTLTRAKDEFVPLDDRNVRMYVCGPTVYDLAHIGNARPVIVFDLVYRLLRHVYGANHVTYVRNITDVDDKINARAAAEHPGLALNEAIRRITEATERQFHDDVAALGCLTPDFEPRATDYIARPEAATDMVRLLEALVARGHAYEAEGHVLFHVPSMPDYGRLARRPLDEMQAGARVEIAPYKRDPMDFVLWKPSGPGEPSWPSPFGPGRPGWHLECSAMAAALLGPVFDIHGGGVDLMFPHHENEIAQSRCAHGTDAMATVWMHNGFLQVEGEKMSKSLGNFVTINQLLADWPGDVIRLAMLRTHYRQPLDWTVAALEEAAKMLDAWFDAAADDAEPRPAATVLEALEDDLNTPKAIAELHALRGRAGHKSLAGSLAFLGFRRDALSAWQDAHAPEVDLSDAEIERLLAARIAARRGRDFAEADRIRAELDAKGIALKDGKDPETGELVTSWEVKR